MSRVSLPSYLLCALSLLGALACQGGLSSGDPTPKPPAPKGDDGVVISPTDMSVDQPPERDQGLDMSGPVVAPVVSGNRLAQGPLFMCDGAPSASAPRLRRIGRQEWTRQTANTAGSVAGKNPFDPLATHQFETYDEGESIDETTLEIYMDGLQEAASIWHTERYKDNRSKTVLDEPSIKCFMAGQTGSKPDDACVETFVRYLLERGVMMRPASNEEVASLKALAIKELEREATLGRARRATTAQIVSGAWMMGGALFRQELGAGQPDEHGRLKLSDWELAQSIAQALDGRSPGAPGRFTKVGYTAELEGHLPLIVDAARQGTISQVATIEQLVEAYVGGTDPKRMDVAFDNDDDRRLSRRGEFWVSNGVREFFQQWLGYGQVDTVFKDSPVATSAYEGDSIVSIGYGNLMSGFYGHEPTLIQQLDDTIARIVAEDKDVFATLLTTRRFYTPATEGYSLKGQLKTNRIYNIDTETAQTREARWVELPAAERAGVLTHPAWLAAHALAFENDPNIVHRGKWVRERMLCGMVPDLPITVEAAFDPNTRDQSARQRMSEQVDSRQECGGCHTLMNPLGYPFEIYNHAGFLRASDHGAAPSGQSVLVAMPDESLNGPVKDAVELSERFAASPYVKRCFIRQVFRYYAGREETMQDACTLSSMERAYDESQGSFKALLTALFSSETFQYRWAQPGER